MPSSGPLLAPNPFTLPNVYHAANDPNVHRASRLPATRYHDAMPRGQAVVLSVCCYVDHSEFHSHWRHHRELSIVIAQLRAALLSTDPPNRMLQLHLRMQVIDDIMTTTEHEIQMIHHYLATYPGDISRLCSIQQELAYLESKLQQDHNEHTALRQLVRTLAQDDQETILPMDTAMVNAIRADPESPMTIRTRNPYDRSPPSYPRLPSPGSDTS